MYYCHPLLGKVSIQIWIIYFLLVSLIIDKASTFLYHCAKYPHRQKEPTPYAKVKIWGCSKERGWVTFEIDEGLWPWFLSKQTYGMVPDQVYPLWILQLCIHKHQWWPMKQMPQLSSQAMLSCNIGVTKPLTNKWQHLLHWTTPTYWSTSSPYNQSYGYLGQCCCL